MYAEVLSRIIPVTVAPTKPEPSIISPMTAILLGVCPKGLNILLITLPSEKNKPINDEKQIMSKSKLRLAHRSLMPLTKLIDSMGTIATAEGGVSGFSLKIS